MDVISSHPRAQGATVGLTAAIQSAGLGDQLEGPVAEAWSRKEPISSLQAPLFAPSDIGALIGSLAGQWQLLSTALIHQQPKPCHPPHRRLASTPPRLAGCVQRQRNLIFSPTSTSLPVRHTTLRLCWICFCPEISSDFTIPDPRFPRSVHCVCVISLFSSLPKGSRDVAVVSRHICVFLFPLHLSRTRWVFAASFFA